MSAAIPDDLVQPFQIEALGLRGRLVRLGPVVQTIIARHDYPEPVAAMLGEAIVLAATLAGALKYDGIFTLQTKGDGPLRLLVVDVTTAGAVRGYAQYDSERLAAVMADSAAPLGSVPRLLGAGHIAFTVDQGEHTDRYQGIVELQGASLAECAHHYFRQSEQVRAGIKIAVGRDSASGSWRAGGLMLQRLPAAPGELHSEAEEDGWRRAMVLMSSAQNSELLDPALAPNDLLFRLFNEDGVRVYVPHPLAARCRCTGERVERILAAMPEADLADLFLDDRIEVTCEFCNRRYSYTRPAVEALRSRAVA